MYGTFPNFGYLYPNLVAPQQMQMMLPQFQPLYYQPPFMIQPHQYPQYTTYLNQPQIQPYPSSIKQELDEPSLGSVQGKTKRVIKEFTDLHAANSNSFEDILINNVATDHSLEYLIGVVFAQDENFEKLQAFLNGQKQKTQLMLIVEQIILKSQNSLKSREELIKYCLRKAFRYLFKNIQNAHDKKKMNLKNAHKIFQQVYFSSNQNSNVLPFRKNSKTKTMNQKFLSEIFQSPKFVEDYGEFLKQFDSIIKQDVKKKIRSLSLKIQQFMNSQNTQYDFDAKRMPWANDKVEMAKRIAGDLMHYSGKSQ